MINLTKERIILALEGDYAEYLSDFTIEELKLISKNGSIYFKRS